MSSGDPLTKQGGVEGLGARSKERIIWLLIGTAIGLIAGLAISGYFNEFALDDPFWREFWSGAPAAGVLAVVGAGLAFAAARRSANVNQEAAKREEWWHRAKWAFDLAFEDEGYKRQVGLTALDALNESATKVESSMILSVTEEVAPALDSHNDAGDNGENNAGGVEDDQQEAS